MIDAREIDEQPEIDYNNTWAIFFIVLFFIGKILLLNMFVGIIIENIMMIKIHEGLFLFFTSKTIFFIEKLDTLNDEQKEWAHIKANILKLRPKSVKKRFFSNKILVSFLDIFKHRYVSMFFDFIIISNIIVITIFWHRMEEKIFDVLNSINTCFIMIMAVETSVEILNKGPKYFSKFSRFYDFIIVAISLINIGLEVQLDRFPIKFTNQSFHFYRFFNGVAKGLQVTKIKRILRKFQIIKQFKKTILNIMPIFWSLLLFIFLILYMYSIVFLNTFCYLKPYTTVNGYDVHFRTFEMSL